MGSSLVIEEGATLDSPRSSYVIEARLGEGGFGETWRARRGSDGALVALKALRVERMSDWKALELFEREAKILRALDHPRIPSYEEFFWTGAGGDAPQPIEALDVEAVSAGGALVLAQQLVPGQDLAQRMRSGARLTDDEAAETLRQVLDVLAHLHGLHPPVIHRDLTPKNIILDAEGRAHLVDFGAIQHTLLVSTVGGSTSVGTFGYVPIEQSMGQARPASDLYALGVTMVAALTGEQPGAWPVSEATSKIELARMGLDPDAPGISHKRRALLRTIDAMIEPIASARPASASDALALLDGRAGALVAAPEQALATRGAPMWKRNLFMLTLGGSIGSALIIYPLNFDRFSESQLVAMAPLWIGAAAFGGFGLMLQGTRRPLLGAVLATIISLAMLGCFFVAIWPSL